MNRTIRCAACAFLVVASTACSSDAGGQPADDINVTYRIDDPYRIDGKRFVPQEHPDYDVKGVASWYGNAEAGDMTASGIPYDPEDMTAAHRTLPYGTIVRVTRVETGESVRVVITDRGPFVFGRVIDLSRAAADELGFLGDGITRVRVEVVGRT